MSDVPVPPEKLLSPSQVRCFMDCQMRWWFKYALKYADSPTGKMALRRAVHAALTQNFAQKVETQEDLPVTGVVALFRDAWEREREQDLRERPFHFQIIPGQGVQIACR